MGFALRFDAKVESTATVDRNKSAAAPATTAKRELWLVHRLGFTHKHAGPSNKQSRHQSAQSARPTLGTRSRIEEIAATATSPTVRFLDASIQNRCGSWSSRTSVATRRRAAPQAKIDAVQIAP